MLIAYDGDSAGILSAIKAGYVLLKNGLNPSIVKMPDGKDPDDWILESGVEPFNNSVKNSIPLIEFSYAQFQKKINNNIADFINETLLELSQIKDNVIAEINLKSLSECTGISFESINSNYLSIIEKIERRESYKKERILNPQNNVSIEDDLLMLCFSKEKKIREEIYNQLNIEWMGTKQSTRIYKQIYIHLNSELGPDINVVLDQLELKEDHQKLASIIFNLDKINPTIEMARDCVQRLHHIFLKEKLEKYREVLKDTEKSFSENSELINKITKIQSKMNSLKDTI